MENNELNVNENDEKIVVSQNIIKYRKKLGLTQLELAEKINYSDKTLSKWERAETLPDIITLKQLANIFNVSVDTLISSENIVIEYVPKQERRKLSKRSIISISLLSAGIVWFIATIAFVILKLLPINFDESTIKSWIPFIYAIPITAILLLVFSCIWGNHIYQFLMTSILLWSIILAIHLSLLNIEQIYLLYILPIPLQIMAFIFFIILKKKKK